MKRVIGILILFIALSPLITNVCAKTASEVYNAVSSCVVVIRICDEEGKNLGLGSGVILPDGTIATNYHVVEDAAIIKVIFQGEEYTATLHLSDWDRDVCSLVVKGLKPMGVQIGVTKRLKVGDRVFAIGAPQGLELSLSEGIISSLRPVDGGQYIQITAPISPGSSGGGLFDEEGHLIGLTTFYLSEGQQLNFAVPVEWINELPSRSKKISKSPLTPSTEWLNKAIALEKRKDYEELLNHSLRWIKAMPENFIAWFFLGIAYYQSGQTDKAIEAHQQALRINQHLAEAWYILGVYFSDSDQTDKAIKAYKQALSIDPEYAKAWYNLGIALGKSGEIKKEIEAYKQALSIDPEYAKAWQNLGIAHAKSGQTGKATECFQQAIRINPQYHHAWFALGVAYGMSGQIEKAKEAYQQALRVDPKLAEAWFGLGTVYKVENQSSKVMDVYKQLKLLDQEKADKFFNEIILP